LGKSSLSLRELVAVEDFEPRKALCGLRLVPLNILRAGIPTQIQASDVIWLKMALTCSETTTEN
jgi:hypothetical protein